MGSGKPKPNPNLTQGKLTPPPIGNVGLTLNAITTFSTVLQDGFGFQIIVFHLCISENVSDRTAMVIVQIISNINNIQYDMNFNNALNAKRLDNPRNPS